MGKRKVWGPENVSNTLKNSIEASIMVVESTKRITFELVL